MSRVAFIGLGAMGSRMALRLLDRGHELVVSNRSPGRAGPLVAAGARSAATPAEAARGRDVVITMLAGPEALHDVTDGIAGAADAGTTVIEMSTVGPAEVRRLRARLPPEVGLIDVPVLGSIAEAESGTLTLLAGGPAEVVERWRPLLEALGTPRRVGGLGAGAAAKLVANAALFAVLTALGEAIALGDGLGLSRAATMEVLAATPLAEQALRRAATLERDDPPPARFALALARKDAGLVLAAAAEHGIDLPLAAAAGGWLADAERAGHGAADYTWVLDTITR